MARIFRATYTKMQTIRDRKGNVVYDVKNGKKAARREPVLGRNGKPVLAESRKWYVEYRDADGIVRRVAGFVDKKATEQHARDLERTAEHIRSGYKPKEHDHLCRPLAEQLAEFKNDLLAKDTSAKQAQQVHNRAKRVLDGCKFRVWADVSATKVQSFLAELRKDVDRKRGISVQTSNWYLQAFKALCAWLVRENRAPESPVAHLQGLNVKTDRRHDRRALTDEEAKALLSAAASCPVRQGMAGSDRALLYRTALESGLRAGELRALTVGVCRLDDQPPVLVVEAAYSKHRREDVQPITPGLAKAVQDHVAGREADESVFPTMPPADKLSKVIRDDLEAAGVPYRDGTGRVADFHALRHTYITNLARSGVHPKVAMDLARHSNINLTLARYSHTVVADCAAALTGLPTLCGDESARQQGKATGTYDEQPLRGEPEAESAKQSDKRRAEGRQGPAKQRDRRDGKQVAKPL